MLINGKKQTLKKTDDTFQITNPGNEAEDIFKVTNQRI